MIRRDMSLPASLTLRPSSKLISRTHSGESQEMWPLDKGRCRVHEGHPRRRCAGVLVHYESCVQMYGHSHWERTKTVLRFVPNRRLESLENELKFMNTQPIRITTALLMAWAVALLELLKRP